ncbi:MAG TPA: site-2 protease family protein [Gemmataceae bacterium]|nr:site-2 protease family protein [Gemmataceae bacterium]
MEQQSPTPQRPGDVKPDAAPPPVPPVQIGASNGEDKPRRSPEEDGKADDDKEKADAPPTPLTPMGWLQANSPYLVAFVAVLVALYYYWGFDGIIRAALVVVGLGLVIFIHELGHFLAAKWCNVHVQTFSLGFGPALPGCSFKWGETTYKIGILPLGGFVQMVGEGADADEDENYPRSYKNKTVLQRMFIISAGVIMNVLLGFVCFAVVYQFHGVEMPPAAVASTEAGSPAWQAGIPGGAVLTKIGNTTDPNFEDLHANVALSWSETPISLDYMTRDGKTVHVSLLPRRDANDTQPVIGVSPPSKLVLPPKKYLDDYDRPARRGSPADKARVMDLGADDVVTAASDPDQHDAVTTLVPDPAKGTQDVWSELCRRMSGMGDREMVLKVRRGGKQAEEDMHVPAGGFEWDDVIVGVTEPSDAGRPFHVTPLKARPAPATDYDSYDFEMRMTQLAGLPAVVEVLREVHEANEAVNSKTAKVFVPPAFHRALGMKMKMGEVAAVRPPATDKVKEGDTILAARVTAGPKAAQTLAALQAVGLLAAPPAGPNLAVAACRPAGDEATLLDLPQDRLDPVRLPYELEKATGVVESLAPSDLHVILTVNRWGDNHEQKPTPVTLDWDAKWRYDQELPFNPASPMAIPELGIAYRVESTIVEVTPDKPAAKAALQPNDRIVEICFKTSEKNGPGKYGYWHKMAAKRVKNGATEDAYDEWAHFFATLQANDTDDLKVKVWRNGAELPDEIEMTAMDDATWPLVDRGILLMPDTKLQKADNVVQAVGMGVGRTWAFIRTIYEGLVSMVTGRIDAASNVEGPINIAKHTFQAAQDPWSLILILGMISVNLAVVNFLPIPVLDGGHMVFLVYELIRRKPPSDAVRAIASYIGLALLASLMLFVVYLDVSHWIWGGGR